MTQFYATSFISAWHFFARTFVGPAQGKFLQAVLSGRGSHYGYCDFFAGVSRGQEEGPRHAGEDRPIFKLRGQAK